MALTLQNLEKHKGDLDGYNVKDIGTHRIRKGATTYTLSGSTASPSSVAINNRGGWTLGTVRDVYMLYEKAGDKQRYSKMAVIGNTQSNLQDWHSSGKA